MNEKENCKIIWTNRTILIDNYNFINIFDWHRLDSPRNIWKMLPPFLLVHSFISNIILKCKRQFFFLQIFFILPIYVLVVFFGKFEEEGRQYLLPYLNRNISVEQFLRCLFLGAPCIFVEINQMKRKGNTWTPVRGHSVGTLKYHQEPLSSPAVIRAQVLKIKYKTVCTCTNKSHNLKFLQQENNYAFMKDCSSTTC